MRRRSFLTGAGTAAALVAGPAALRATAPGAEVAVIDGRFPGARRLGASRGAHGALVLDCGEDAGRLWHASLAPLLPLRPRISGLTTAADLMILADLCRPVGLRITMRVPSSDGSGLVAWRLA